MLNNCRFRGFVILYFYFGSIFDDSIRCTNHPVRLKLVKRSSSLLKHDLTRNLSHCTLGTPH